MIHVMPTRERPPGAPAAAALRTLAAAIDAGTYGDPDQIEVAVSMIGLAGVSVHGACAREATGAHFLLCLGARHLEMAAMGVRR